MKSSIFYSHYQDYLLLKFLFYLVFLSLDITDSLVYRCGKGLGNLINKVILVVKLPIIHTNNLKLKKSMQSLYRGNRNNQEILLMIKAGYMSRSFLDITRKLIGVYRTGQLPRDHISHNKSVIFASWLGRW